MRTPTFQVSARKRAALRLLTLLPWLAYFGLVFAAGWFVMLDGDSSNDTLGWTLLTLALPCLFVAARVSSWQRRWIDARFNAEMWARGSSGSGGGLLSWLDDWP